MKFLLKNLPQKILALTIATTIWFFASLMNPLETTEYQFSIPVSYINLPKELVAVSGLLQAVDVRIGVSSQETITPNDFQISVNMSELKEGTNDIVLPSNPIISKVDFNLITIQPNKWSVKTEALIERELPIRIITAGQLETGLIIQKITISPDKIFVKGPSSALEKLDYIETHPVSIQNLNEDKEFITNLNLPENIILIDGFENITGKMILGLEQANYRIDNVSIILKGNIYETRINPGYVTALVAGPKELIESANLNLIDVTAYINLNDYKPGNYKIKEIELNLPPEIVLKRFWPPVDVWILNNKLNQNN